MVGKGIPRASLPEQNHVQILTNGQVHFFPDHAHDIQHQNIKYKHVIQQTTNIFHSVSSSLSFMIWSNINFDGIRDTKSS